MKDDRNGWPLHRLGELTTVASGGTPLKSTSEFWNGDIPWYTSGELDTVFTPAPQSYITPAGLDGSNAKMFPAGSLLIGMYDTAAMKMSILDREAAFNQAVAGVLPADRMDLNFVRLALELDKPEIMRQRRGVRQRNLSLQKIKDLVIPLPPLEEQQRIVEILDRAFEGLARARENAEANLKSAKELFQTHLIEQFSKKGTCRASCTIGDLITLQRGFDITKKDQRDGKVPVVSSGGIKSYHSEAKATAPGVVVGRKGSIGSVHFVDEDYWPHDTTLWVKDFKGNVPRLVYYLLRGLNLANLDTGAANPSLNRNLVHPLNVFWPENADHNEQMELADRLTEQEMTIQKVMELSKSKLEKLDGLRQSLLKKAFSGQLT